MDPITQGLLGAAACQAVCQKKLGKSCWWVGILAGMAADLDIVIRSPDHPLLLFQYHRHFTHALTFIPVGGILLAATLCLIAKPLRQKWPWVLLGTTAAYATHGLLDAATSYGTVLWWPFSETHVAWDIIPIIDPFFTSILLLGVLCTALYNNIRIAHLTLLLACWYLSFGIWQHHRALNVQQQLLLQRSHQASQHRVMPNLGSLMSWRSLYITNGQIFIDDIRTPITRQASSQPGIRLPHFSRNQLPESIKTNATLQRDFDIFYWFSDGYVSALSDQPLLLADLRYYIQLQPLTVLWGIEFPTTPTPDQHINWRRDIKSVFDPFAR